MLGYVFLRQLDLESVSAWINAPGATDHDPARVILDKICEICILRIFMRTLFLEFIIIVKIISVFFCLQKMCWNYFTICICHHFPEGGTRGNLRSWQLFVNSCDMKIIETGKQMEQLIGLASTCCTPLVSPLSLISYQKFACSPVLCCLMPYWRNWWSRGMWEPMPAQKFRWDESSGGDSAGEWRYVLPRKKRARKSEAATAQDSRDTSKTGVKGSDRRRTYLEVILNTQRDSESEQQNDVDLIGAGAGASGAAAAASGGAFAGKVTAEKKRAQEEAKRRMERIQAALTQLVSGDNMKEVRDKLNQEMSRAKKASEPQHLANDIEGEAAWVSREARRLNGLEVDIAKLQAHLIQKRRDLQVEVQELDVLRAQLAKNTGALVLAIRGMNPFARAGET